MRAFQVKRRCLSGTSLGGYAGEATFLTGGGGYASDEEDDDALRGEQLDAEIAALRLALADVPPTCGGSEDSAGRAEQDERAVAAASVRQQLGDYVAALRAPGEDGVGALVEFPDNYGALLAEQEQALPPHLRIAAQTISQFPGPRSRRILMLTAPPQAMRQLRAAAAAIAASAARETALTVPAAAPLPMLPGARPDALAVLVKAHPELAEGVARIRKLDALLEEKSARAAAVVRCARRLRCLRAACRSQRYGSLRNSVPDQRRCDILRAGCGDAPLEAGGGAPAPGDFRFGIGA